MSNTMDFVPSPIPPAALAELEALIDETAVSFDRTLVREHDRGCDVIADASWTEFTSGSGSRGGSSRRIRRTIVLLHRPDATLPEFQILPKSGFGGGMLAAASRVLGLPTLDLDDEPEVASRYAVMTVNANSVRTLLLRPSLDALTVVSDLNLKFGARGVLAWRGAGGLQSTDRDRDDRLDEEGRRLLLEDAVAVCGPIVDDPEVSRRAADAVEGTYAEEAARNIAGAGGIVGRLLSRTLITREMTDSIREQRPPRSGIPAPIAMKAWRGTTFPLLVVGGLGLGFSTMAVMLLFFAPGSGDERIAGAVFGGVGVLALVATFFVVRHRWTRIRIVRRGHVVEGSITRVERTDTAVNGDTVHRIHLALDGREDPTVAKAGTAAANSARRMLDRGARTWALVDPADPRRCLWIEGWSIESIGD